MVNPQVNTNTDIYTHVSSLSVDNIKGKSTTLFKPKGWTFLGNVEFTGEEVRRKGSETVTELYKGVHVRRKRTRCEKNVFVPYRKDRRGSLPVDELPSRVLVSWEGTQKVSGNRCRPRGIREWLNRTYGARSKSGPSLEHRRVPHYDTFFVLETLTFLYWILRLGWWLTDTHWTHSFVVDSETDR